MRERGRAGAREGRVTHDMGWTTRASRFVSRCSRSASLTSVSSSPCRPQTIRYSSRSTCLQSKQQGASDRPGSYRTQTTPPPPRISKERNRISLVLCAPDPLVHPTDPRMDPGKNALAALLK